MTTALITGVGGQDGTLLARRLVDLGHEVWGLTPPGPHPSNLLPEQVRVVEGDLRDREGLSALVRQIGPDQIYNLAAISSVAQSWEQPALAGLVSGLGAVHVFEAALGLQEETGREVRVVQASSSELFGSPETSPQTEDTPIQPVSPYGAAKAYAHHMGQVFRSRGLPVSNLILFAHESPLRPPSFVTRKITSGAARVANEGGVIALGNLAARRDWGYAGDYGEAMRLAAEAPEARHFVIGTGQTHSVEDFARLALQRAGVSDWRSHIVVDPRFFRPVDPVEHVADATKAREVLGWQPTVAFEGLVNMMVDADLEDDSGMVNS